MSEFLFGPTLALLLLALGLAADAFAVSVAQGACCRAGAGNALKMGAVFGLAQAVMPLFGWGLGVAFAAAIRSFDHWVAFVLLAVLGAKMVREGMQEASATRPLFGWALFGAAVATSVDAAAAGITLPTLGAPIALACLVIGGVTAAVCFAGVLVGAASGARIGRTAEIGGGILLIAIGTKILIEHQFLGG